MSYHFKIALSSPNPYITHTFNNIDLITTLNKEKKNWIKKYYKNNLRIEDYGRIHQNIIKLADAVNNKLANIETILLQTRENS